MGFDRAFVMQVQRERYEGCGMYYSATPELAESVLSRPQPAADIWEELPPDLANVPPPPPAAAELFRARAGFGGGEQGQLALREGDVVEIVEPCVAGKWFSNGPPGTTWSKVKLVEGQGEGFVPHDILLLQPKVGSEDALALAIEQSRLGAEADRRRQEEEQRRQLGLLEQQHKEELRQQEQRRLQEQLQRARAQGGQALRQGLGAAKDWDAAIAAYEAGLAVPHDADAAHHVWQKLQANLDQAKASRQQRDGARAEAQRLLQQGLASVGAQDWDSAIATLEAALAIAHADDAAFQVWGELQTWLDHAKTEKEKGPAIPPAAAHATETVANMGLDRALVEQVQLDRFEASGQFYTDMMALMSAVTAAQETSQAKAIETAQVQSSFEGKHEGQLAVREGERSPSHKRLARRFSDRAFPAQARLSRSWTARQRWTCPTSPTPPRAWSGSRSSSTPTARRAASSPQTSSKCSNPQ